MIWENPKNCKSVLSQIGGVAEKNKFEFFHKDIK